MKFTVSSTELLNHLQAINRVINNKNSLPILDNFLFELTDRTLTMTASDLETTLVTSMELVSAEGEGKVAVQSRLLLDTLKEFSDQPLDFEINDSNLAMVIKSPNGEFNFIGQDGDEYPIMPELTESAKTLTVAANKLSAGIANTIFCTADDDLRPVMNGVLFDMNDKLTLVATDAHKLVRFVTDFVSASSSAETALSFILPKKAANTLKNILVKETGDVEIVYDEKNIRFQLGNYTMVCRQIEGKFPNYNAVIPRDNSYKIIADRETLLGALKRVAVFSNQASNLIKLDFNANTVQVSAQDIDFSISGEETVACQYEGEPLKIGFKSSFLIDMMSNLAATDIVFELSDPSRAGLILPVENVEGEEILMLLMPMLLND
ncbi:DNA polymerase III subunit beta [Bacteroidia bacterium]|nr:DNA polymerase III subunit beta [Bacteroidia bacterium]GHV43316.1 DNA polymerase III subunit beta [Bacteroidia bacterium]